MQCCWLGSSVFRKLNSQFLFFNFYLLTKFIKQDGYATVELRYVEANIIETDTCNAYTSYGGLVQNGMICAGSMLTGNNACQVY